MSKKISELKETSLTQIKQNDLKELIDVLEYYISEDNGIDWIDDDAWMQLKKYKSIIKKYK